MDTLEYTAYDLRIRSALPFPELSPIQRTGPADVSIRNGRVPDELEQQTGKGVLYQANHNEFLLKLDGVARFLVRSGNEILVDPAPDCIESDLRVFVLGSCIGALLHQRGILAMHASAILSDKGAVLFVGPTTSGKSTTLARIMQEP